MMMNTKENTRTACYDYIAAKYGNALAELAKGPDDPKGELALKREEREKKEAEENK
jgi:hypothetical protein